MLISRNKRKEDADKRLMIKFQFVELNKRLMWCDFGANLVQHFMRRYSRYSRYRTKTHDKCTINARYHTILHDITRYSRYQTVLSKLQEIITHLGLFRYTKSSAHAGLFVFVRIVLYRRGRRPRRPE